MQQLLFFVGNMLAIVGGFLALFWVVTNKRRYWTRRRRGIMALVFIAVGVFIMVSSQRYGGSAPTTPPSPTSSASPVGSP